MRIDFNTTEYLQFFKRRSLCTASLFSGPASNTSNGANLQPGVVCGRVPMDSWPADRRCCSPYHSQVTQALLDLPSSGCFVGTRSSVSEHRPQHYRSMAMILEKFSTQFLWLDALPNAS